MGVTGLWGILEPTGKPVRIQSLKGKVLSVDVSIWLHQSVKGFRDKDGNPLRNAHLLGVFHRVCKLLSHGIKPIFVFDGGVPALKKQTMSGRRQRKIEAQDKSQISRNKLLQNLLRQQLQKQYLTDLPPSTEIDEEVDRVLKASAESDKNSAINNAVSKVLSSSFGNTKSPRKKKSSSPQKQPKSKTDEEFDDHFGKFREKLTENFNNFALFFSELDKQCRSESESDGSDFEDASGSPNNNHIHGHHRDYDENFSSIVSPTFDELPLEIQHEMLFDMQESKKNNSWGKIDQMPKDLQNFSSFQMERLRKRRTLQKKIQSVQKEMGQRHIHLSNFDDLAAFNYEDVDVDAKDTKIVGSKEQGLLYVANTASQPGAAPVQAEPIAGPSTSRQSQPGKKLQQEVITIDDFVTDGWSSSDDEGITRVNTKVTNHQTQTQPEALLSMALTEEEQLQEAIRLSLEQHDDCEITAEKLDASRAKTSHNAQLSVEEHSVVALKPKPVGIVTPFQSIASASRNTSACGSSGRSMPSQGVINEASEPRPDNSVVVNDVSESSSESEFEEVTGAPDDNDDASREAEKPKLDLEAIFNGIKEEKPVLTIAVNNHDTLKAEDDLFADIFEKVEPKSELEIFKNGDGNRKTDEVEFMGEVFARDRSRQLDQLKELQSQLKFLEDTVKSEESKKSGTDKKEDGKEEGESSDSDFENVDIDIIVQEPQASEPSNLHNGIERDSNQNQTITRTLGVDPAKSVRMISAQYMQAQEKLVTENEKLKSASGFQERVATSITDQMYIEAQELLALFGVPFMVSPMEAESQCAFLDTACLTEGTVTDDSDVWLFGGQRVYKNFFSQGDRQLELYQYADIVSKLNLDREKLILIGILTGSDYTDGVESVGPVKALEILSEFPSTTVSAFDSLIQFRDWITKAQEDKLVDKDNKIRNKFRKLKLRPGFPSKTVYDAYMDPTINDSTEPFRWGQPDLDGLRAFAKNKFGWDQNRCDANLLPLIKTLSCQMQESTRQLSMDSFLTFGERHAAKHSKRKIKSKRLENAMKKLKFPDHSSDIKLSSESESESDGEGASSDFKSKGRNKGSAQSSRNPQQRGKKKQATQDSKQTSGNVNSDEDDRDMDAELKDLLDRMGVKRMTVKRGGGNEDQSASTSHPTKIPKKGKQKFQKSQSSVSVSAAASNSTPASSAFISSEVREDLSTPTLTPTPSVSCSASKPPLLTTVSKSQVIYQKAREQHAKMMQKKKAIELFKSKKKEGSK